MTEILFGTPNSKTKGSLGLLLKISTENPEHYTTQFNTLWLVSKQMQYRELQHTIMKNNTNTIQHNLIRYAKLEYNTKKTNAVYIHI